MQSKETIAIRQKMFGPARHLRILLVLLCISQEIVELDFFLI